MTYAIQLPCGKVALVDAEDFDRVSEFKWSANRNGYAQRSIGYTKQSMHRFILSAPDGCEVDHRNGNKLDNRRINLRLATRPQNQRNSKKKRHSKNKYKGIRKNGSGWMAQLSVGRRGESVREYLGSYSTEEAAARAYDIAAHNSDPEFARLNFNDGLWSQEKLEEFRLELPKPISGIKGVQPNGSNWSARLKHEGKNLYLGTYKSKQEASAAVEAARIQYKK